MQMHQYICEMKRLFKSIHVILRSNFILDYFHQIFCCHSLILFSMLVHVYLCGEQQRSTCRQTGGGGMGKRDGSIGEAHDRFGGRKVSMADVCTTDVSP
jgi:hypothetical protein